MNRHSILGIVIAILGILALLLTVRFFLETLSFQQNETRTSGVIVSIQTTQRRYHELESIPVVSYKDNSGVAATFTSNDMDLSPESIKVGDQVPVAFDKNHPNIAHIYRGDLIETLWFYVIFYFAASFLILLASWKIFKIPKNKSSSFRIEIIVKTNLLFYYECCNVHTEANQCFLGGGGKGKKFKRPRIYSGPF